MIPMIDRTKNVVSKTAADILKEQGQESAAFYLARTLFAGRVDKAGAPYIGHLERVVQGIRNPGGAHDFRNDMGRLRAIGWLHDLLEDIPGWTADDLRAIGFDDFVVDGVVAMTKSAENAPYFDEIVRLGQTPQAIPVKKSDLRDNGDMFRLTHVPRQQDLQRVRKYFLSYHYLDAIESNRTTPGTAFVMWMMYQDGTMQDWDLARAESRHPAVSAQPGRGPGPAPV